MNKNCFVCGNDWCLNLIDNPENPEDNICCTCQNLSIDKKCLACTKQRSLKDLYQILGYIFILFLFSLLLLPLMINLQQYVRL